MLLTTVRGFRPGVRPAVQVRLSFRGLPRLVQATVEAVESREVVESLVYETRARFVDLDRRSSRILGGFCAEMANVLSAVQRTGDTIFAVPTL